MQWRDGTISLLTKWPRSCLPTDASVYKYTSLLKSVFVFSGLLLLLAPMPALAEHVASRLIDNTAFLSSDQLSSSSFARIRVGVAVVPPSPLFPGDENPTLIENDPGGTVTPTANTDDQLIYEFSDPRFEISGGELKLIEGVSINFETEPVIDVALVITNPATGGSIVENIQILVIDVNEEPTEIIVDNNFVPEGVPGAIVGALSVVDEDLTDSHTFDIIGDDRFTVNEDDELVLVAGESLGVDVNIPVTVSVIDKGGLSTRIVVVVTTDPDNVIIEPSASTVSFLQNGVTGDTVTFENLSCNAGIEGAGLSSVRGQFLPFEFPGSQQLDNADSYAIGDPVFVSVADSDQNIDPRIIDTVQVTVTVNTTGDSEVLTLFESNTDTGKFFGFILSTQQESLVDDCRLSVATDTQLSVLYVDVRDVNDTSQSTADVAPVSRVFDDVSGELIDDIILTLVEASSNTPAEVRGDGPGFGLFPSALKSGSTVTDTAGKTYTFSSGAYRFPSVPEGDYFIEVFNDIAFKISDKSDEEIRASAGANQNFVLVPASRGIVFHVRQGAIPRIDIPLTRVEVEIPMEPTLSVIEFLQFSPILGVGEPVNVEETFCVAGVTRQIVELKGAFIPVPGVINLLPVTSFKAGEPVFIRVTDGDQNRDSGVRERITIEVSVPVLNETEFLELTETGPNSGVFVGYVQTTEEEAVDGNCELSVRKNEIITTSYTDSFDRKDTANSFALIDPFGVVFNTSTGEPIDGITITLISEETGQPALVFGDGPEFAPFPATLVTGGSAVDEAGMEYDFPPGNYRYPFVGAGFYHFELSTVPEGFIIPSTAGIMEIQALPGAPFAITAGSRLGVFQVVAGPALKIDIPIDVPDNIIVLSKSVSRSVASIGEFVQYKVKIANEDGGAARNVTVIDTLPPGLRYQKGSFRLDGEKIDDPIIDSTGSVLQQVIAEIPEGETAEISYVVEITAGTPVGEAINRVIATGDTLVDVNAAEARIFITEDLLRSKAILTGKVSYGECDDPQARGMSDVLIYMEDGTGVLTDLDGNWHIEGVTPGTHVVQLDLDSLAERYQIAQCNADENRNSGRAYSQFVDVQGGTLWTTDFHIVDRPPPKAEMALSQLASLTGDRINVKLEVRLGEGVPLSDASVFYKAPRGWKIASGSEKLNGVAVKAETTIIGYRFRLPAAGSHNLELSLEPREAAKAINPTIAETSRSGDAQSTTEKLLLRPRFSVRSAELKASDVAKIYGQLEQFKGMEIRDISITGHSDNMPIAVENRKEYADNYQLSRARATTVARIVSEFLDVALPGIAILGAGPDTPVADNGTASGRSKNRRVEIRVTPATGSGATPGMPDEDERGIADFVAEKPLLSKATLRFQSMPTREGKGKTKTSEIDIRELPARQSMSSRVMGYAVGSWDEYDSVDENASAMAAVDVPEGIVSLTEGQLISTDVLGVRVKLSAELLPELEVDGILVPNSKIGITIERSDGTTLYTYVGVDFGKDPGDKIVLLRGIDKFGEKKFEDTRKVIRTGQVKFFRLTEMPGNIADGKTPIRIKVDLLDGSQRPVKTTAQLRIVEGRLLPYTSEAEMRTGVLQIGKVDVSSNGIAKFFPVSKAGFYRLVLAYEEFKYDITIQVKPQTREWVMVGLGEGIVGYNNVTGNMRGLDAQDLADDYYNEGRLAFFAKGMIKGEWLTTLSYDTDRIKDGNLFRRINAGQYYTLYGDSSSQRVDSPTQEKLYVRIENDKLNATYGDFSTNLSNLQLSGYSRRLTGMKVAYVGERFAATAFASDTTQAFIRDDIQGNGTSGIYRLSADDVIQNSEQITFEVRDRFHNEIVLEEAPKTRDFDYSIDYERGELIFKKPVFSQDFEGNPVFIVVKYEIDTDGREKLNTGGRLAMSFNEGRGIVGTTVIREEVQGREAELTGVDLTYQFGGNTELIAEVVTTEQQTATGRIEGDAYSVSLTHQSPLIDGSIYIREEEEGFGIGQTSAAGSGTRQIGADATLRVNELVSLNAQMYRDESLADGRTRDVISSNAEFQSERLSYAIGMQSARDSGAGQPDTESQQITGRIQTHLLDRKLMLRVSGEAPVGSNDNEAFPTRLLLGGDYKLTKNMSITGQQEFTRGENQDTQRTVVGLRSRLWEGADVNTTVTQEQGEDGRRILANYGLVQTFQYNENLAFDFGIDRSQTMKDIPVVDDNVNPNARPIFGSANGDFTALTVGANYNTEIWRYVSRLEYRDGEDDQYNFSGGALRNLENGIVLAAIFDGRVVDGDAERSVDNLLSFGFAYRPDESRWNLLNRLELAFRKQSGGAFESTSRKIVNNMNANYKWDDETQISMQYAFKYVLDTIDGEEFRGYTDLIGGEIRRNLLRRWDIGLRANVLHSWNSGVLDYSYGVSVGRQFATNTWVSVGYNFDGFRDSDFDDSDYTAKGVYLKFRFKFDQDTAKKIFKEKNVFSE